MAGPRDVLFWVVDFAVDVLDVDVLDEVDLVLRVLLEADEELVPVVFLVVVLLFLVLPVEVVFPVLEAGLLVSAISFLLNH